MKLNLIYKCQFLVLKNIASFLGFSLKGRIAILLITVFFFINDNVHANHIKNLNSKESGLVFVINAPENDLKVFKNIVHYAKSLTPYGKVRVNISTLSDKGFHEIPEGGSSWHEYASSNPTPSKFFPDKLVEPFIPSGFVLKNRNLMLAKAKILQDNNLEGAFLGYEPNFLPEEFYEANPHMLGPRVDHPRRSKKMEFAPSVCSEETRQMYSRMIAKMLKEIPVITMFGFKTNDAGAGIDWSDWLYAGANGPLACKNSTTGERVKLLLESFQKGAKGAGKDLMIYLDDKNSNFSDTEKADIEYHLPKNCFFSSNQNRKIITVGSLINTTYPVRGLLDPVSIIQQMLEVKNHKNATIYINFRAAYDRGVESEHTIQNTIEIIRESLMAINDSNNNSNLDNILTRISAKWCNERHSNLIKELFLNINDAFKYKSITSPRISSLYWGVTMRLINRPLVFDPMRLDKSEEAYFLPYIFNVSEDEARNDYIDLHGSRVSVPTDAVFEFASKMEKVAKSLEDLQFKEGFQGQYELKNMSFGFRMYSKILISCAHFIRAQEIRDRTKDFVFNKPASNVKEPSWLGHPDFIQFNEIMRNEYDNIQDLIDLMDSGGKHFIIKSNNQSYEDSFLLGPDFYTQLILKRKIMWKHWQDIEDYLASPHK